MEIKNISEHIGINLYGHIDEFSSFDDLFEVLENAREADTVTLKINSGGGRIDVGWMIVQAIRESKAHVIARVVYPSYSMASLIALACDDLAIDKHALLMFHNYSGGSGGKGAELIDNLTTSHEYITSMFYDVATPFLTAVEMKRIIQDRDVYIKHDDKSLAKRIKRHYRGK